MPYISNPEMAFQKASIPKIASKEFCLKMLRVNQKLWKLIDEDALLRDTPRLAYLQNRYDGSMSMQEVLKKEALRIESL